MKTSIRTKFTIGILFFFVIIAVLSVFSAYYLNKLSKKTAAILKENHLSVIYAREMSEDLMYINQEITSHFLTDKNPDSTFISNEFSLFNKSLQSEKNNITEPGEDKLVSGIGTEFKFYGDSVAGFLKTPGSLIKILFLQKEVGNLYKQLILLSQINEKAIEIKTNDAKVSAKNALTQMTFLATFCFLIALSFTYSFSTYFSERFFQLYNGIKELGSSNYGQRLHFEGKDEFYDISLVFNKMAEKLSENKQKMELTLHEDMEMTKSVDNIRELKSLLLRIKNLEEQARDLIFRIESKS
jgi:two-component system, NtrC family, sensor histidine kinase KinB